MLKQLFKSQSDSFRLKTLIMPELFKQNCQLTIKISCFTIVIIKKTGPEDRFFYNYLLYDGLQ